MILSSECYVLQKNSPLVLKRLLKVFKKTAIFIYMCMHSCDTKYKDYFLTEKRNKKIYFNIKNKFHFVHSVY